MFRILDLAGMFLFGPRLSIFSSSYRVPAVRIGIHKSPVATANAFFFVLARRAARLPATKYGTHGAGRFPSSTQILEPLEPCQRSYGAEEYSNLLPPFIPLMNYVYCRILCDTLCPGRYAHGNLTRTKMHPIYIWQDNNCVNFIHFVAQTYQFMMPVVRGRWEKKTRPVRLCLLKFSIQMGNDAYSRFHINTEIPPQICNFKDMYFVLCILNFRQ